MELKNLKNLPHVLTTFDSQDGVGHCVLNVGTDLVERPGMPGYDAEALDRLRHHLAKLINPQQGYDKFTIHFKR
ncbi:hypothetical protein SAMN05519104_4678 [Rhizobiales bacterium GAS188]|nr:hypothetical protein SAMN05519104_4678 [Rhizobiales bacterium GAS188]